MKYFTRKLGSAEYFSDNSDLGTPDSSLVLKINKSSFSPLENWNSTFKPVIKFYKNKASPRKTLKLSAKIFKKNKDIIVKAAGRGRVLVIMNTKPYLQMISDHLNDETTYKLIELICDAKVMKAIAKIIEKCKANLTTKEKEYLINFWCNTSNFYGLPKIHKSRLIQNAIKKQ